MGIVDRRNSVVQIDSLTPAFDGAGQRGENEKRRSTMAIFGDIEVAGVVVELPDGNRPGILTIRLCLVPLLRS